MYSPKPGIKQSKGVGSTLVTKRKRVVKKFKQISPAEKNQ